MLSSFLVLMVSALTFGTPVSQAVHNPAGHGTAVARTPIRRGAPIGSSPAASLADILKNPNAFAGRTVVVAGVVQQCCRRKGCWMELSAKRGAPGVRVTFKDYGFFVPTNSSGMKARAEGTVVVKQLDKAMVDHMVSEGAHITPAPDGTATEVSFIASGVELRR
ncbi:MAG TPA: DUF4920 domain-containing protein [Candidatus Kapabacteria bacterium]|nr:DUF4920 domain-containing protein [Candidatus Kapabacteria bacterium]